MALFLALQWAISEVGADRAKRECFITSEVLYQLSYVGVSPNIWLYSGKNQDTYRSGLSSGLR
jgi:hypothetical protein